jgi:hypothetical protein
MLHDNSKQPAATMLMRRTNHYGQPLEIEGNTGQG